MKRKLYRQFEESAKICIESLMRIKRYYLFAGIRHSIQYLEKVSPLSSSSFLLKKELERLIKKERNK